MSYENFHRPGHVEVTAQPVAYSYRSRTPLNAMVHEGWKPKGPQPEIFGHLCSHIINNDFSCDSRCRFCAAAVLSSIPELDIVSRATTLQKDYSYDLSEAFPVQLVTLASSLKSVYHPTVIWNDLAHLLIVACAETISAFTDIVPALLMFPTLLVTVATAE
jgi:hypothetical protein